ATLSRDVRISATDWIHEFSPKLGLGEYFIIEIPKGRKTIKDAWKKLEKAEECFRKWDLEGVHANCRQAGKILDKALKEKFGKKSFTYNERWGRAYLRFFNYLVSLGLHLEEMKGNKWEDLVKNLPNGFPKPKRRADYKEEEIKRFGKTDAEHVLITCKALIKYAEELLEE
ncbi:hypothetical protein J7L13_00070, partial [bacterium]|nr:hypothetical protein [bacterium]